MHGVPISTLKLNAKILAELQLIKREDRKVSLSASGNDTIQLLRELDQRADQLQGVS